MSTAVNEGAPQSQQQVPSTPSESQQPCPATMKGEGEKGESSLGIWKFDQVACRNALAKMIIIDELPFKFVDHEGFSEFCTVMQPYFNVISRFTVARDCVALYTGEKEKLRNLLTKSGQRICLTTDSWTSIQNVSYMCLTAHFIDKDWKLHKRILNFCVVTSHKGEAIGRAVETCLVEWGIEKLCTLTVDNATANDVAIEYLKKRLSRKSGTFILGGEFFQVRCSAHILNLIVKDGLTELKYSLTRIRDAVKYVRSSPQREQRFKACVEKERITFKNSLILDVPTRWNSTYLMLAVAIKFQAAFERLKDEDPHFILELNDNVPQNVDWDDARVFTQFLEKIYDATVLLSGSSYCTSPLFFTEVCAFESSLSEWSQSMDYCLSSMAIKMKKKFDKYWGKFEKVNLLLLLAVVLDPRCKIRYLRFGYSEIHEAAKVNQQTQKVIDTLNRICGEYAKFESSKPSSHQVEHEAGLEQPNIGAGGSQQAFSLKSKFQKHLAQEGNGVGKSEVDRYLEETCENDVPNFDLLNWWKVNSPRYAVLSQVARDLLAIPVSSVASESAFSTGGRVLDRFRSSLTPKLVECLICGQDWFRASPIPIQVEENTVDMEDIERGNIYYTMCFTYCLRFTPLF
ncbi:hypothetical protein RHGRI_014043 [Rhododendron griersonianum]|uniref:Transposase n=1 Tax=Rhododendron griersonianum TaxID=479676 RepID=A0AAV6K867_9ERIC|nr:hypothetical protein RHGRI_014043 [Rhododendron griersonianum]